MGMRISRRGDQVLVGDTAVEPGVARALAASIEQRLAATDGHGAVVVDLADLQIRISSRDGARRMVEALRRHAAAAEVVRRPVTGEVEDERDVIQRFGDLLGRVADLLR